jgi:hypothetical protein
VIVVLPSIDVESIELIAARTAGPTMSLRTFRDGRSLAADAERLWIFFEADSIDKDQASGQRALAPIVFSWLASRGANATRFEVRDLMSVEDLRVRLSVTFATPQLFSERLIVRNSVV